MNVLYGGISVTDLHVYDIYNMRSLKIHSYVNIDAAKTATSPPLRVDAFFAVMEGQIARDGSVLGCANYVLDGFSLTSGSDALAV